MPQRLRKRKQHTHEYSANNRVTESLSRGMIYRELYVRLQGAATATTGNNTKANTMAGDEWGAVKKIEVIANGTDVIKSIDGNALWWLNYFMYRNRPKITTAIGNGTANPAFDSVLILPLWMVDGVNPMDTALDSRNMSSLEIAVTWGTFTDINSAATAWTTEPTLEIYSSEVFGVADGAAFANWRVFQIEKEITSNNPQFQIQLPIGGLYRGFMINTTDAGVDQGDILNNLKLVSGTTVFHDIHAQDDVLPQVEMIRRGLARDYDAGAGAYEAFRRGAPNSVDGWYWVDHVMDGLLTEAIDTLGLSEFTMECDVTVGSGTTKINVYPMQIIPVRGGSNGS